MDNNENGVGLQEELFVMSVPDEVTFGLSVNVGQMRAMTFEERVPHLRKRMQFFLIDQVDSPEISKLVEDARKEGKIDSNTVYPKPFQLPVMTCVAIEALAQIAFCFSYKGVGFRQVASKIDSFFNELLAEDFKADLLTHILAQEPRKELEKINTYGDLLYMYFRNSMIHGYRAQGIFLNHLQETLIVPYEGFLILNPLLFWKGFVSVFNQVFDDIETNIDSVYREQCRLYLERMLG